MRPTQTLNLPKFARGKKLNWVYLALTNADEQVSGSKKITTSNIEKITQSVPVNPTCDIFSMPS